MNLMNFLNEVLSYRIHNQFIKPKRQKEQIWFNIISLGSLHSLAIPHEKGFQKPI